VTEQKEKTSAKSVLASVIDKASVQNVVAAAGVIVGLAVTAYFQKWELFAVITGACTTYLFPKTQK